MNIDNILHFEPIFLSFFAMRIGRFFSFELKTTIILGEPEKSSHF